jgi:hypothetical protein
MVSSLHEALVEMVRHRPAVVADVLSELFKMELPAWRHTRLEALMDLKNYEFQSDFFRRAADKYAAKAAAKEKARDVLMFLDARGIDVPDTARTRITECTDIQQIDTWVRRAATADSIDDVLD